VRARTRENNFNLIRLLLALLVIFGHSPELIDGNRHREWLTRIFGTVSFGELAVDGFFLLSGYLIMQSWDSQPQAWAFLKKRLLRIYPGFIVASVTCAFIVGPLASVPSQYFGAFDAAGFMTGLLLLDIPVVPPVFEGSPYANINGAMWTISREFSCYLFVLIAGVTGALRLRHFCLGVTALLFAVLAWFKLKNIPVMDMRLASFFLSGACYYRYREHIKFHGGIAAALAAAVAVCMFSWRGAELAMASIGGYVLLYLAGKRSATLSHFNRLPDVSYGVYLYGWPIQKLLLWYCPSLSPWALSGLAATAALVAGTFSWYLVEKPALRFKGPSFQLQEERQETVAS
jgi:peptidoglycan/LPS O-acetylase OafA/YrhL